jgi:uncharacterized protein with NAD-binding domain and iron-sulfur cluster
MAENGRKKIAVLGGGISSLTTVCELTSEPGWQEKYEITIYQLGWRIGGKGASGRNRNMFNRIEEHGYHMWFGFYDNAFHLLRDIYEENARPLDKPMAVWSEAFKPVNYWVIAEHVEDHWITWPLEFRANPMLPGEQTPMATPNDYIGRAIRWISVLLQSIHHSETFSIDDDDETTAKYLLRPEPFWRKVCEKIKTEAGIIEHGILDRFLFIALSRIEAVISGQGDARQHHSEIVEVLDCFINKLRDEIKDDLVKNTPARRLWIITDIMIANIRGMIEDDVVRIGFNSINQWDYRDWLKKHGATELTLKSPLVQGFYALVFCGHWYSYEAGTALRSALELLLNYKGSVYWKMEAGMGDVVFGPIYEVLKKRGVNFKFFHQVKNLEISEDGKSIASIEIDRQVTIKKGEYEPMYDVRGLPCWPSEPLYEQIVEGEELQKQKINLESHWSPWKNVETIHLQAGKDFDQIVLGISIAALPEICKEIIDARPEWQAMMANVKAIPTMGIQMWMYPDIAGLGSPMWRNDICMVSTYVEPCDTWADKSDVLIRESWPDEFFPNSVAYLTGPMEPTVQIPPASDRDFPAQARDVVKGYASDFLNSHAENLWPRWIDPITKLPDWKLLVDPQNRTGEGRLNTQFFRANVDPTEHYVLSVTNSTPYRLRADQSGYSNLFLTGDWTLNFINAGCIEAAVMSGMLTALAVQGQPLAIQGEEVPPASVASVDRAVL